MEKASILLEKLPGQVTQGREANRLKVQAHRQGNVKLRNAGGVESTCISGKERTADSGLSGHSTSNTQKGSNMDTGYNVTSGKERIVKLKYLEDWSTVIIPERLRTRLYFIYTEKPKVDGSTAQTNTDTCLQQLLFIAKRFSLSIQNQKNLKEVVLPVIRENSSGQIEGALRALLGFFWMALSKTLENELEASEDKDERDIYMGNWISLGEEWLNSEEIVVLRSRNSQTDSQGGHDMSSDDAEATE